MKSPNSSSESEPPRGPASIRRRKLWIGCGSLLLLFGIGVWIVVRDDPPPDDSELLPPIPTKSSIGESVLGALLEIHAALPGDRDWEFEIEDANPEDAPAYVIYPWRPWPLDRSVWGKREVLTAMQAHFERCEAELDRISRALEMPGLGWAGDKRSGWELSDLSYQLQDRALWLRARGDSGAASRDLETILCLGERVTGEGSHSLMLGAQILEAASMGFESLIYDGSLDPGVEARFIAREPIFDRDRKIVERFILHGYLATRVVVEKCSEGKLVGLAGVLPDKIPFGFKRNRTQRRIAQWFRKLIAEVDRAPLRRDWPAHPSETAGSPARRALLHFNSGELLLPMIVPNLSESVERIDRIRLAERATRLLVALVAFERTHGTLPPDLETLVTESDGLDAVPLDLYSGAPFRYDHDRRILWSVGTDGIDGEGAGWKELRDYQDVSRDGFSDLIWIIP